MVLRKGGELADQPVDYTSLLMNAVMAGIAGLIGIITGIRVHSSRISDLDARLTRIENKIDRLVEMRLDHLQRGDPG